MREAFGEFLEMYYRTTPERTASWLGMYEDWLVVACLLVSFRLLISAYQRSMRQAIFLRRLNILLAIAVCFRFVVHRQAYLPWQRLPFYSCGLASVSLPILYYLTEERDIHRSWLDYYRQWCIYCGIYGGLCALFFSAPSEHMGLHAVNTDFYACHFLISLVSILQILNEEETTDWHGLFITDRMTSAYLIFCLAINAKLGSNFGFVNYPPIDISFLGHVARYAYIIAVFVIYQFFNHLTWRMTNRTILRQQEKGAAKALDRQEKRGPRHEP